LFVQPRIKLHFAFRKCGVEQLSHRDGAKRVQPIEVTGGDLAIYRYARF